MSEPPANARMPTDGLWSAQLTAAGLPAGAASALGVLLGTADSDVVGLVLSGSAARGLATAWSDVDVHVVLAEGAEQREVVRTAQLDQVPVALYELERPPPFGSDGWAYRWS